MKKIFSLLLCGIMILGLVDGVCMDVLLYRSIII